MLCFFLPSEVHTGSIVFGKKMTASDAIYRVSMYTFCLNYSTRRKQPAPFYHISSIEMSTSTVHYQLKWARVLCTTSWNEREYCALTSWNEREYCALTSWNEREYCALPVEMSTSTVHYQLKWAQVLCTNQLKWAWVLCTNQSVHQLLYLTVFMGAWCTVSCLWQEWVAWFFKFILCCCCCQSFKKWVTD